MAAVIVANGDFPLKEYPLYLLRTAEFIVCCDASRGLEHLERLGLAPDLIVGDMDSAGRSEAKAAARLKKWADRIVKVDEQDDNDLAKAMRKLRARRPDINEIHILGATGRSNAHTLGNYGWLMEWEMREDFQAKGISVDIVSDYDTALAISRDTELEVGEGRKVSLFTTDPTLRIHSEGLHWSLDGINLTSWQVASLNKAERDSIALRLSHRAPLLIILD